MWGSLKRWSIALLAVYTALSSYHWLSSSFSFQQRKTQISERVVVRQNEKDELMPPRTCRKELEPRSSLDSPLNPFRKTILNDVVTLPWRPCRKEWQFEHGSLNHSLLSMPPVIFSFFDWVLWEHDLSTAYVVFGNYSFNNRPRTILLYPGINAIRHLKKILRSNVPRLERGQRRSLVIAGQDTGLGGNLQRSVHKSMLPYFTDIWCTAKDRPDPFIHTIPLGLNPYYIVKAGVLEVTAIVNNYSNAISQTLFSSYLSKIWSFGNIEKENSDSIYMNPHSRKLIVAAWGRVWRFLDVQLKHRASLIEFLELPTTKPWLNRSEFTMLEYWKKLSEYKYSICPPGNGVQTPKVFEAMLVHTVPVTLRLPAFEDLKALGFPMLLVDAWTDLNVPLLEESYEREFSKVNWARVKAMLRPEGVMDIVLSWNESIPLDKKQRARISAETLRLRSKNRFRSMRSAGKEVVGLVNVSATPDPGPFYNCSTALQIPSHSPFLGNVLSEVAFFHWRPCHPSWKYKAGSINHTLLATPPPIFALFDWVVWQHDFENEKSFPVFGNISSTSHPRSILVHPDEKATRLLALLLRNNIRKPASYERRTLVIAGQDTGLGGKLQYIIHRVFLNYFTDIWCTAKDRKDPFIHALPLGINPLYVIKAGLHSVSHTLHEDLKESHRRLVFTAWGRVWRFLDVQLKHRASLIEFLELPTTKPWLNRSEFTMLEYWKKLSEYKYSICPPGNGVQTPKVFEAMLVHTVPVTLRLPAFEDLKALGFPMLLVDAWTDLNVPLLEESYEREFSKVNWARVKAMLRPEGVMDIVLSWNESIPRRSKLRSAMSKKIMQYYKP